MLINVGKVGFFGSSRKSGNSHIIPNPITDGLWAEFIPNSRTVVRELSSNSFVSSWSDNFGDGSKKWTQDVEISQPELIKDMNGIYFLRGNGISSILKANDELRDWLRSVEYATLVVFGGHRSTPTIVKRVIGFSVANDANQLLVLDNNTSGLRRIQARRTASDSVKTLIGPSIPTTIQREAVRFRPIEGEMDYIGENLLEITSTSFPTSGPVDDASSQGATAIFGYANSFFCDYDLYYVGLYRTALSSIQLEKLWAWGAQRFKLNSPELSISGTPVFIEGFQVEII